MPSCHKALPVKLSSQTLPHKARVEDDCHDLTDSSKGGAARLQVGRLPSRIERDRMKLKLLEEAHIVCSTLSFSGSNIFSQLSRKFDVVVIDEAAQAVEPAILVPLVQGAKQVATDCHNCLLQACCTTAASAGRYAQHLVYDSSMQHLAHDSQLAPDRSAISVCKCVVAWTASCPCIIAACRIQRSRAAGANPTCLSFQHFNIRQWLHQALQIQNACFPQL